MMLTMKNKTWFSKLSLFLLLYVIWSLLQAPTLAIKQSYIVYFGSHAHGPEVSEADFDRVTDSHYDFLGSFLGSKEIAKDAIIYSYQRHINGFSANLEEEMAAEIEKHPKVVSVFLNQGRQLHTTHSWEFMLMEKEIGGVIHPSSLWEKANFGEDIIIGNLDTGVWPKSKSFSGTGYGPIPSKWKGICQNDTVPCNRKLIGARYFNQGYTNFTGPLNSALNNALDHEGHGSHTLSTAGGNFVPSASVLGVGNGTAKGGSPKARVAAYKVCWKPINGSECFDNDIMAAFDMAIHDGVDVLSMSLGGNPTDYFNDGMSIGAFHAVKNGIVVISSAGNSGPKSGTVTNVAPWMITVGASTLDREFESFVKLHNGKQFKGASMSKPLPTGDKFYPLISAAHAKAANASAKDAMLCKPGTLDPKKAKGKILACLRGETARVDKGEQAALAGAVGMILCNDKLDGNEIIADPHVLPATQINYKDGVAVFAYINSTNDPLGYITAPTAKINKRPAPFMASFSSVGPSQVTPEILKPDVTAPGVNIIAAYTGEASPSEENFDKRRIPFITMSGTSMSCPHVSGVVGLLKKLHPDWSPSAIKSALMTTARRRDNTKSPILDGSFIKATPFNYGAGHIRPNRAMDPGLVYDLTVNDYLDFLCASGYNQTLLELFTEAPYKCPKSASLLDFNYPSITVTNLSRSVNVTRKLKNVGSPGTYVARVREPIGISVHVEPKILKFESIGEEKSFKLTVTKKTAGMGTEDYVFGVIIWSDGNHYVRSPIVVGMPLGH
ncbi:subtilisin-like protease SBT5.4 [Quercus lobata]|uniref:subtilisin-like protease SBT5.4 n=1 Tax=Quercus lobata TaxID=97700 RepID=UPI0012444FBF|nr:subtilisin-like protease SBT5.4 [Quercus lobata]XP_030972338.1 subtilisin-like protease SBT5.4 [Quercus lobata]